MDKLEVARAYVPFEDGIVLVRRAGCSMNNDLWELPGGKVEYGQSLQQAAVEETEQETGLVIEPCCDAIPFTSYPITEGKHQGKLYAASFVIARVIGGSLVKKTNETSDIAVVEPRTALRTMQLVDKSATVLRRVLEAKLVTVRA